MSLRIRRGTDAQRQGIVFDLGEILYTTDNQQLWVGDGITAGAKNILATSAGAGLVWNAVDNVLEFNTANLGINTSEVTEGSNKYFTTQRAQDAAASLFTTGSHSHITFAYDDVTGKINATVTLDGVGLLNLQQDVSPSLGGNLNLNSRNIVGTGNINTTGTLTTSGTITGSSFSTSGAVSSGSLSTSGAVSSGSLSTSGTVSCASFTTSGTITSTLGLGGNLILNGRNITGNGNININSSAFRILNSGTGQFSIKHSRLGIESSADVLNELNILATTDGTLNNPAHVAILASKGTIDTPTNTSPGDILGIYTIRGYRDGNYYPGTILGAAWAPNATFTGNFPASIFSIVVGNNVAPISYVFDNNGVLTTPTLMAGDGSATNPSIGFTTDGGKDSGFFHPGDGVIAVTNNGVEKSRFDAGGIRTSGFMKVGSFNGSGNYPSPAEVGMIILDSSNGNFYGYSGTSWKQLNN
jgi:hypothetical protein